jgi:pimeloyl-ACP methyl ester carboxylesterase
MQPITVATNGTEIAYETFGASGGRPLLLVAGLGAPMLAWHPELCAALVAEDFFVVRYDNRDVGLSTHLHDAPPPNLDAARDGDFSSASYRLEDMADDAVGLLDALGLDRAHVVGVSLGGMIAQTMAITHPDRLSSLTSIISSLDRNRCSRPGDPGRLTHIAAEKPRGGSRADREHVQDHRIACTTVTSSPARASSASCTTSRPSPPAARSSSSASGAWPTE